MCLTLLTDVRLQFFLRDRTGEITIFTFQVKLEGSRQEGVCVCACERESEYWKAVVINRSCETFMLYLTNDVILTLKNQSDMEREISCAWALGNCKGVSL